MKMIRALAMLMLFTGPAMAQHMNLMPELKSKSPEEREQDAITEKAYRESLRKIPDAKAAADPWGTVRSDAPKAAPAKPRTKTGSAAN
ncbi:hypothetical protein [Tardiphaga sp.]|jgi:hypothetical protein|uniref:hypothetical protein n=1 Tax=Tardiphaga sp. TaxID=1926292 RepID=UPI0019AE88EB|nr:hypothetical protein [Tardiphaga sp.]MBC7576739.1 hypothetical protein [Tardiphaga sp.]